MHSPITGAGYLCLPKRSGTREEVIARCKEAILNKKYDTKTLEEKLIERHEKEVWRNNEIASGYPVFIPVGPPKPTEYVDERMRTYIWRYGHARQD